MQKNHITKNLKNDKKNHDFLISHTFWDFTLVLFRSLLSWIKGANDIHLKKNHKKF